MKLILSSYGDDKHFSYRLNKHPDTIYSRKLGDNTEITASFSSGGEVFSVAVEHDIELILKHCRETNKASYNDAVFWLAGPYNLKAYNEVFRSVLRGRYDASLIPEIAAEEHQYTMDIGPVSHYDKTKIDRLTAGMNINITDYNFGFEEETSVRSLFISGKMTLTAFLQKIYLFLYAYQYQYSLGMDTNEKLAQFKGMFENWIEEVADKEYLFECLAGKRLYKLAKLNEEYGLERVSYVEERIQDSLHTKRHQAIAKVIKRCVDNGVKTILDAGCGSAQLLKHLKGIEAKYIGFDSNPRKTKVKLFQTNMLFPFLTFEREASVMVLSEVIEHFDEVDRKRLYELVNKFYQPNVLIVTTPNQEYNKTWELKGYRHPDHKIEFDSNTIKEVFYGLSDYELISTIDLTDEAVQPSFIFVFSRVTEQNVDEPIIKEFEKMFSGQNKHNLNKAFCSNAIVQNYKDIFYLGPTIAPAPHDENFNLESYTEAIDYYKEHGVTDLTYQVKEMGSRAYILWFRSYEHAKVYGYDKLFICNSRGGFPFFEDKDIEAELWFELCEIAPKHANVVMLDCEITPWSLKGDGLIKHMFNIPLYAEKMHHEFLTERRQALLVDVNIAIETLKNFDSKDEPMKIHIFDVLYMDGIPNNSIGVALTYFWFPSKHFKIIETSTYFDDIIMRLEGKEGLVIKPTYRQEGILPAIKVRHPDFLRLIYGAHYKNYLDLLSNRPLSRKRRQSHQQYVTSRRMIESFGKNDHFGLLLNAVSFIAEEKTIDATL